MSTSPRPLISIIIPVYNVELYLRECLDSVVNQTLREIEIICVNDCSTDGSPAILREYEARDERVIVIDKLVNEGLATARNVGMEVASGKYMLFVDSDDFVDVTLCRKTFDCAEKQQVNVVIYDYAGFVSIEDLGKNLAKKSELAEVDPNNKLALLNLRAYAWTKLIRSDHARAIDIRFPDGLHYEDAPVHWTLVTMTSKVALLPERLCFYRQRSSSIGFRTDKTLKDHIMVYDRIQEFLLQHNLYDTYRDFFLFSQLSNFCVVHDAIDKLYKKEVLSLISERMDAERWQYIQENKPLNRNTTRDFFLAFGGSKMAKLRRAFWLFARRCYRMAQQERT